MNTMREREREREREKERECLRERFEFRKAYKYMCNIELIWSSQVFLSNITIIIIIIIIIIYYKKVTYKLPQKGEKSSHLPNTEKGRSMSNNEFIADGLVIMFTLSICNLYNYVLVKSTNQLLQ